MGILQRYAILGAVVSITSACTAQSNSQSKGLAYNGSGATPPGLTCPVMTKVEYDNVRYKTMLGASPENPMICLVKRNVGAPEALVLNWYAADRLHPSQIDQAVEVLSSLLIGPVGFTTSWNRFLGSNSAPYETRFIVVPDQNITIGGKNYGVRVIKAKNSTYEDNEYWIDKESLTILKYIDHNNPLRNYSVTGLVKVPES